MESRTLLSMVLLAVCQLAVKSSGALLADLSPVDLGNSARMLQVPVGVFTADSGSLLEVSASEKLALVGAGDGSVLDLRVFGQPAGPGPVVPAFRLLSGERLIPFGRSIFLRQE